MYYFNRVYILYGIMHTIWYNVYYLAYIIPHSIAIGVPPTIWTCTVFGGTQGHILILPIIFNILHGHILQIIDLTYDTR